MNLVWTFVLTAFGLAVLGFHFAQFRAALLPKRGTLEWITLDEAKSFAAGCKTPDYTAGDILPMVLTGLLSLLVSGAFLLRGLQPTVYLTADPFSKIELWLYALVCPVMATATSYCVSKRIAGGTVVPSMVAVVTALDVSSNPAMLSLWLLAFAFFVRLWGNKNAGLPQKTCDVVILTAFLALSSYFVPSAALFAFVLFAMLLLGCILRRRSFGRILLAAFGFAAAYAVWLIVICVPAMMLQTGRAFPQMLLSADFWTALLLAAQQHFAGLSLHFTPLLDRSCFAVQCYGIFCLAAAVYAAIRCRELDGFLLAGIGACLLALCLFDAAPASLFAIVLLAYVWKHFSARGKFSYASAFFAAICIVTFAADLTLFLFM